MELSVEDARDLISDDLPGWEMLEEISNGSTRWELHYYTIAKHLESCKCYSIKWSRGATEQQDTRPFEYYAPKLVEVEPYEVKVIKWRKVSGQ